MLSGSLGRPSSRQFSDPLLVSAYDALNALGADRDFWLAEVERLAPRTIIDLGCGTGLLTCELARRGHAVIGIDPAPRMLDMARRKPFAGKVQWIEGGHERLAGLKPDMVLMTSHVAQFFLDENEWRSVLHAAHAVLNPGGHLLFDSRSPILPPFRSWPIEAVPRRVHDPTLGAIVWHHRLLDVSGNRVRYELHFRFSRSGKVIVSTDELIFRSRDELTNSLGRAGFEVVAIHGDWQRRPATPADAELIFVAVRP